MPAACRPSEDAAAQRGGRDARRQSGSDANAVDANATDAGERRNDRTPPPRRRPTSTSRRSCSAATCSAGPPTRRPASRCSTPSSTRGGTMIDTADVYSAWVPGHKGGESETRDRRMAQGSRASATRCRSRPRSACCPARAARSSRPRGSPRRATPRSSGSASSTIDLYYAHQDDDGDAAGGGTGGVRQAGRRRARSRARRVQLPRRAAQVGATTSRASARPAALSRCCSPNIISSAATSSRASCRIIASSTISACCPITASPRAS